MTNRIDPREISGLTTGVLEDFDTTTPPAEGQVPVWDDTLGKYVPGTPTGGGSSTTALVPLTTVVGGVPELVWDDDNNLVMTEVPL